MNVPHPQRRLLIVNADDYGLTAGVSRAIIEAHRRGIVTSTSVLAVAPGFSASASMLRDTPGIGVGAHLAAVGEDPPLLSAREVPSLVDRRGRFSHSWRKFVPRIAARRVDPDDLRREFAAQIAHLRGAGLMLTHVDTHQHVHLWPSVAEVVLDVAAGAGINAVRVVRSAAPTPVGVAVRRLGRRLERRAADRGFAFPLAAIGLDEAGVLSASLLTAGLERLAAARTSTAELSTHPGEADDADLARYRWGYSWGAELAALTAPESRAAVDRAGFTLGTYADLAAW